MGGGMDGFWLQAAGELRVVNVRWNDGGWNVNANPVSNPNEWNAGNRVFASNNWISPAQLLCGSFRSEPFTPSTNHPA
jgi:hypothetical protein